MRWRALLEFLAIGAVLFAVQRLWTTTAPAAPDPDRVITRGRLAELRRDLVARAGGRLGEAELAAWLDTEIANEILFREALALGLQERDPVIEQRLIRNMRFLEGSDAEGDPESDAALLREARAMGMDRSDLVVRRRLIQRMRLAIEAGAEEPAPTGPELAAYLAAHPDRFRVPGEVRLSQLFFARDRRGEAATAAARAALASLRASGTGPAAAAGGDPFLAPRDLPLQSPHELGKLFGPDFAARVMELPVGVWSGPVRSAHGMHVVWVHERVPSSLPPLADVRDDVRHALLAERRETAVRDALTRLRARYRVEDEPSG